MQPHNALPQFTSYSLQQTAAFLRRLADAADAYAQSGIMPPGLFPQVPGGASVPPPGFHPQPSYAGFAAGASGGQRTPPPASEARLEDMAQPSKKRRKKFSRAPTGYNNFVKQRMTEMKESGEASRYSDSKEAFRAVVEEWRALPEEERRSHLSQTAAQVPGGEPGLEEPLLGDIAKSTPSASVEEHPELEHDTVATSILPSRPIPNPEHGG